MGWLPDLVKELRLFVRELSQIQGERYYTLVGVVVLLLAVWMLNGGNV